MDELVARILSFFQEIGLPAREGSVPEDSLLPGVYIRDGVLVFERSKLLWPGDLLHEAGHIAVMPSSRRRLLNGLMEAAESAPHSGEVEATAWAYAAVRHLGVPASVLFHEGGYHGKSSSLIFTFEAGVYPGAHGLAQAGMAAVGGKVPQALAYPHMTAWLRE